MLKLKDHLRTYLLFVILHSVCLSSTAQEKSDIMSNLSCLYAPWDNCGKITSETTALGKRHVGYAYVEIAGFSGQAPEAYGQFFWEQKFWESPVFIHAEYRAVAANAFYEGTGYLGGAYCFYTKYGYLALEPLLMWKQRQGVGGQFSVVGGWDWKHFILEHYTDVWKTTKMDSPVDVYSQTRLFYKVYGRLSVGVIGEVYCSPKHSTSGTAYLAVRWRF